jgi:hypothetical protein
MRGHAQPAVEKAGVGRQRIAAALMHDTPALEHQRLLLAARQLVAHVGAAFLQPRRQ